MKKRIPILLCALLLLFTGCGKETASDVTQQTTVPPVTEATADSQAGDPGFFENWENMQVRFEKLTYREEIGSLEQEVVQIQLTEEERKAFLELLKPYDSQLTEDILKSDYLTYYHVKLNDHVELVIDAEHNTYDGDDVSYMFVRHTENGVLQIYGTYINIAVVEFLDAKR